MRQCDLRKRLSGRIHEDDIHELCYLTQGEHNNKKKEMLYSLVFDDDKRISGNALWVFTHFDLANNEWLYGKQDELTDRAMTVADTTNRRLLLTLLNRQEFSEESLRTDFLDFCLGRLLVASEPPGIRSLYMKLAYKICRHYPELLEELRTTLDMMLETSSPAIKTTRKNILKSISAQNQSDNNSSDVSIGER